MRRLMLALLAPMLLAGCLDEYYAEMAAQEEERRRAEHARIVDYCSQYEGKNAQLSCVERQYNEQARRAEAAEQAAAIRAASQRRCRTTYYGYTSRTTCY